MCKIRRLTALVSRLWLLDSRFVHTTSKARTASCVSRVHSNFTKLILPASSAPSSLFRLISSSRLLQAASAIDLGIAWSFVTIATILLLDFDGRCCSLYFARCVLNSDRLIQVFSIKESWWSMRSCEESVSLQVVQEPSRMLLTYISSRG